MFVRRQLLGWKILGVLAALGIVLASVVAVVDHERKNREIERANVAKWFCLHRGMRCAEKKPDAIEDAWETREHAYAAGAIVLILAGGIAVVAVRRLE